jgi:DegV family protein with EDD domain
MQIRYLDGYRLYYAFVVGGNAVIQDRNYLNKINVFPVPDSDTGTNMASTMRSIAEGAVHSRSAEATMQSIVDSALSGARGNSGLIFAQFLYGISEKIKNVKRISTSHFGESVKEAVSYAYKAIVSPVEGTMLTVMKDWADAVYQKRKEKRDFADLLSHSLQVAKRSLTETPKKLAVLARAGVVDAGAKGFVDFLEGITNFIKTGKLRSIPKPEVLALDTQVHVHSRKDVIEHRFCTEALITGKNIDLEKIRKEVRPYGVSAIVAGSPEKMRIHIHTNNPADLFFYLKNYGTINQIKADDMLKQYVASHQRKSSIGLVTDSSCDLPQQVIDDYQIHVIPFNLSFGDTLFLDKITITPQQFYTLLKTVKEIPKSAIPPLKTVQSLFSFLASHYESLIVVNISEGLSGAYKQAVEASSVVKDKKISLINSKHLSVTLSLIVLRIAQAIQEGKTHDQIVQLAEEWVAKTKLFVDIKTLKYMVRGGRVSPLKGLVAQALNIKPLISLDSDGKAFALGKSFTRRGNMKKIVQMVKKMAAEGKIWNYGIVHAENLARAEMYTHKLEEILHKKPTTASGLSVSASCMNKTIQTAHLFIGPE